jgi:hypothetical protein
VSNRYESDPLPEAPVPAPAAAPAAAAAGTDAGSTTSVEHAADAGSAGPLAADSVQLNADDLVAAIARSGISKGPLTPSFEEQASPDAAERLDALPGRSAEILAVAVAALANPPRSALAQFSVADESVSRLTLAWDDTMEQVTVVARKSSEVAVSLRSPDEVSALLAGAVGLDGALEPLDVRVELSRQQAIAWVAFADTLRRARLQSMLIHGAPSDTCTVADVTATLATADAEDFRWALNMLDKVLPDAVSAVANASSITEALEGLVAAGVLNKTPAGAGARALYGLADVGTAALDAWSHEVSRVAVTVHGLTDDGGTTAETVLLVRDARRLWLVTIGSERGTLTCVGTGTAERVLRTVAGAAIPESTAAAAAIGAA